MKGHVVCAYVECDVSRIRIRVSQHRHVGAAGLKSHHVLTWPRDGREKLMTASLVYFKRLSVPVVDDLHDLSVRYDSGLEDVLIAGLPLMR